ncbi:MULTISPECIES: Spy/CpxP family protein refolding chaperone [unclassified Rubrivivax]|uniref:Spy/CpxP family protein refolding chaperone n=1 Tax=unclassified Rubrivivax TaxID=2649762 RepID=UPI0013E98963|nr:MULTISPECIES: Spy/CpxP family protein refolding chaperone [unclassified Rubrivivax]MCC9598271.1 Spy/CpxP family protein refolding chaperone [Rubrivivax sp. JA1055]MCC9645473.1 Spy/CpxP family protein refolding chaperone [Rubrivivax sp. JA1029]MCD0417623.1 Spy/CpxP family protein refolding chaperone [Rubrivivax sp. JA1024]
MKPTSRFPLPSALRTLACAALLGAGIAAVAAPPGGAHPVSMAGGPMGGPGMDRAGGLPWLGHPAMLQRLLDEVDATPAQRRQIREIVGSAQDDLSRQRADARRLGEQFAELFVQPTVDPKAVEALRQKMLALHDQSSQRSTQAMLEVSRVLSVEQRQQIADTMKERREAMDNRRGRSDPPRR